MKFHSTITVVFLVITCVYMNLAVDIKPELKSNVLNFEYGVNLNTKACYIIHLIDFM